MVRGMVRGMVRATGGGGGTKKGRALTHLDEHISAVLLQPKIDVTRTTGRVLLQQRDRNPTVEVLHRHLLAADYEGHRLTKTCVSRLGRRCPRVPSRLLRRVPLWQD